MLPIAPPAAGVAGSLASAPCFHPLVAQRYALQLKPARGRGRRRALNLNGDSLALAAAAGAVLATARRVRPPVCRRGPRTGVARALTELAATPTPPLRFRCLLLDHDDTTVKSTKEIHHPAHVESVKVLRPELLPCSLEEWFEKNHDPGVSKYLASLFSPEQMHQEHEIWLQAMASNLPPFYDGMAETLAAFRARGGLLAVVSHSPAGVIARHYDAHPLAAEIYPDLILGWDSDPTRRKPAPWPALHALERLGVAPSEALVLDDLSPGASMARTVGVRVAAAGWGHTVTSIEEYMRRECDHYFSSVPEFSNFLLGDAREREAVAL